MPENSEKLMQAFVAKLETTGTLEDAVDVADSYGALPIRNYKNPCCEMWNGMNKDV